MPPDTTPAIRQTDRDAARANRPEQTRSIEGLTDAFRSHGYIAERSLATTVYLALELGRPLLLEGEAGVGMDHPVHTLISEQEAVIAKREEDKRIAEEAAK